MKYHDISHDNMLNGDGLRVVLWVAGCEHHCKGCQNPVTWDPDGGLEMTVAELAEIHEQLSKDYISGITFSGGDPLHPANRKCICRIVEWVKYLFPTKTIWCYTGYLLEEVKNLPVMQYIDVLVDGEFVQELADPQYRWAGSKGQVVWRRTGGKWMPDKTCCRIIPEFPNYLIYADGRVYSLRNHNFMTQKKDRDGYLKVRIFNDNPRFNQWVLVSRLVARAFLCNYDKEKQVHHIDGNVENNSVDNLMCVTNDEHAELEHDKRGFNKKPVSQYTVNGKLVAKYRSSAHASEETGICATDISECARGVPYRKTAGGYVWRRE